MKKHIYFYRTKLKNVHLNFISVKNVKLFVKSTAVKKSIKQKIIFILYNKNRNINLNNIKKFCFLTGRLRSMVSLTKYNRITFRELVSKNQIPGVYKK